jgi:hypothetical protein
MARPNTADIDATKTGWVATLNSNFEKVLDTPFPIYLAADLTALNANNASLYDNCFAILQTDSRLYISNGSFWILYDAKLDYIADLVPGVATVADIKNTYNSLIADMKAKGMMAIS